MLTAVDFLADYPEFGTVDSNPTTATAIVQRFLDQIDALLSNSTFGTLRDYAAGLYTAHRLSLRYRITQAGLRDQQSPGVVTNKTAGTNSLTVATQPMAQAASEQAWRADLARTSYGLEYLAILDGAAGPGELVVSVAGGVNLENGIITGAGIPIPGVP